MTLDDVFQPNQYGTIPIIDIHSIGTITKYSNTTAKICLSSREDEYIPLTTTCEIEPYSIKERTTALTVNHSSVDIYNKRLVHLKIADSSERLIINVIDPNETIWYMASNGILRQLSYIKNYSILPNGTGWVDEFNANEQSPVTFYYEDILYRLDLQGELK